MILSGQVSIRTSRRLPTCQNRRLAKSASLHPDIQEGRIFSSSAFCQMVTFTVRHVVDRSPICRLVHVPFVRLCHIEACTHACLPLESLRRFAPMLPSTRESD